MSSPAAIHRKAVQLGKYVLEMTAQAGSGHPSSALSLTHIVTTLMYDAMRWDPAKPHNLAADRLVLSEGHAVPIIYAALADLGALVATEPGSDKLRTLTVADLRNLRRLDSVLDGHPNPAEGVPFFDAATGSLGMGLSVAAGLAIAARRAQSPRRVFVIVGDGESREGQIWEAADFIADQKLLNVCAIFNCNGKGQAADVSPQQSADQLAGKLAAFGWETMVIDGHAPELIKEALARFGRNARPFAIVAKTIKGWGVQEFLSGNWHGKPLEPKHLPAAETSLDEALALLVEGAPDESMPEGPPPPPAAAPPAPPAAKPAGWPTFREVLANAGLEKALATGKISTRRAYGAALRAAGDVSPHVCALDADVSNSTFSEFFAKAHEDRFFECKIAEQNMVSTAVGLAAAGYIPFVNSFAKFIVRGYDQVELANISRANVKIVGSHSGITPCSDGPSQMALTDAAFFHALASARGDDHETPLVRFYQPADAVAAVALTRLMVEQRGLCYMRTHRPDVALLYEPQAQFEPGGVHVVRPGEDLALVASGYMTHVALEAAQLLAKQNIRAAVIDAYSLPLSSSAAGDALQRCGRRALVIEDNFGGGFGAAFCSVAAMHGGLIVKPVFCRRMPKSAREVAEILEYCGLSPNQIADQARTLL